ncbi:MAG: formylglycine-generating enzyme family protein [Myxococcales bacterium]|nr:formylglycine-generating enzyme family protein [Myxococcales bacterium]
MIHNRNRWMVALAAAGALLGCDDEGPKAAADQGVPPVACPDPVPAGVVCVPAGEYLRGSPDTEPQRDTDETRHTVALSRPFLIRPTEVTQGEWVELLEGNPAWFAAGGPGECRGDGCADRPVEMVNFYEALAWLNARSEADGLTPCYDLSTCRGTPGLGCDDRDTCDGFYVCNPDETTWDPACDGWRLPTEAEWEAAARAGVADARYGANLDQVAWYSLSAQARSHVVGGKQANAFGLFDMLGNVGEWVWDRYDPDYGIYQPARQVNPDPLGAEFTDTRVIKGCGWKSGGAFCRFANRENDVPGSKNNVLGFRAARSVF